MHISPPMTRLIRLPQVMDAMSLRPTAIYARAKAGLLTHPIKFTSRSSAWPESADAAIIADKNEDEEHRSRRNCEPHPQGVQQLPHGFVTYLGTRRERL